MAIGAVGSAAVLRESLPSEAPFKAAAQLLAERHGDVDAVLTFQIGGINGVLGAFAASILDRPLLDGDTTGRAFTVVHETVLGLQHPLLELAFAGASGSTAFLQASSGVEIEALLRSLLPAAGGWGVIACHHAPISELASAAVPGSVSRAIDLGAYLSQPVSERHDTLDQAGMTVLFDGNVVEVTRRPGVYAAGVATLQHRHDRRRIARLDFANEYVAVSDNGQLVASAPHIITVLDHASLAPISADNISQHQRVRIVSFEPPPELLDAYREGHGFGLQAHGLAAPGGGTR